MDFDLSEEQTLLKDGVTRLLRERYPFEVRRRVATEPSGWSRALWSDLAAQGVLAVGFADADGGCGGPVEAMIVGEAMGAALCAEPYLSSIVIGAAALKDCEAARARIPDIVAGKTTLACTLDGLVARKQGDGWIVDGTATPVAFGDSADRLVIAAPGLLACVDAQAAGVERRGFRTLDGLRAAEIALEGVWVGPGDVLAVGEAVAQRSEAMQAHAIAFLAAEASGLMGMLLDATVEHLKTRKQFGQSLSKFQSLQHRAVDMLVALEQARSMAIYAAAALQEPDLLERRKAIAAVKVVIANAARSVGQQAVQLHGGIGLTEEHRVGWGLRRLTMIELAFGDADAQAARLAAMGGFVAPV